MDKLQNTNSIPESHKAVSDERMKEYRDNPDNLLDWDDIKNEWF